VSLSLQSAALLCLAFALSDVASAQTVRARRVPLAARTGAPAPHAGCAPLPLTLPVWSGVAQLGGLQTCSTNPWPFTARHTPDGTRLYVPLFGGLIGSGGCAVARLDPVTLQPLATIPTGEGPQDVAFVTDTHGALRLGFVANSAASTVTVFNANDQVVATVVIPPLPGGPWPTAFPSGLVASPDGRYVYVGTSDGQGRVHALNTATLALDPTRAVQLGASHTTARLAMVGELLVIPATELLAGFTGATAKLCTAQPGVPGSLRQLVLASDSSGFLFPSPMDVAVDCDGTAWVAGFDMGPRVFAVDPATMTLRASVPSATSNPDGKFQALGLAPDGLLVVADYYTDELALIDARRRTWLTTLDPQAHPIRPRFVQDIEFSPRWPGFLLPCALGGELARFLR